MQLRTQTTIWLKVQHRRSCDWCVSRYRGPLCRTESNPARKRGIRGIWRDRKQESSVSQQNTKINALKSIFSPKIKKMRRKLHILCFNSVLLPLHLSYIFDVHKDIYTYMTVCLVTDATMYGLSIMTSDRWVQIARNVPFYTSRRIVLYYKTRKNKRDITLLSLIEIPKFPFYINVETNLTNTQAEIREVNVLAGELRDTLDVVLWKAICI